MSLLGFDGFDQYGSPASLLNRTGALQWTVATYCLLQSPGRNGAGQCVNPTTIRELFLQQPNALLDKDAMLAGMFAANMHKGTLGFSLLVPPGMHTQDTIEIIPNRFYLNILDTTGGTATVQFRLLFDQVSASITAQKPDGTLLVWSGNNAFPINTWCSVEVQPTIDGASGILEVRVNGVSVITHSGLDLQASSNSYFSGVSFTVSYTPNGIPGPWIDDFYVADTTADPGTFANDSFIGGPAVVSLRPIGAGSLTQWTPLAAPNNIVSANGSLSGGYLNIQRPFTLPAGLTIFVRLLCGHTGAVNALQCALKSAITGTLKMALYAEISAAPGGPALCTSAQVTNPGVGIQTLAVTSGPEVYCDNFYWLAIAASVPTTLDSIVYAFVFLTTAQPPGWGAYTGAPYAAAFPTNPVTTPFIGATPDEFEPNLAGGYPWAQMAVTVTQNWEQVAELVADGDATYNTTAVSGNEDLFVFSTPLQVINSIIAVSVTTAARAEAGAPTLTHRLLLGGTDYGGDPFTLGAGYTYNTTTFLANPHTSSSWTLSELTGMQAGYRLT